MKFRMEIGEISTDGHGIKSQGSITMLSPTVAQLEKMLITAGVRGEAAQYWARHAKKAKEPEGSLEPRPWLLISWRRAGRRRLYTVQWKLEVGARK